MGRRCGWCVVAVALAACGSPSGEDAGEVDAGLVEDGGRPDVGGEPQNSPAEEATLSRAPEALLQDALDTGQLTLEQAALYNVYAQFATHLLPPEYRGDASAPPADTFAWAALAQASRASYTPAEQANLDAIFAPPGTREFRSFNVAPDGAARCIDSLPDGNESRVLVQETAHFKYFVLGSSVAAGGGAPADAVPGLVARLNAALDAGVANQGAVSGSFALKDYFEAVYAYYVASGFRAPTSLPEVVANGGKIPVYVYGCGDLPEGAHAVPNGEMFASLKLSFEDPPLRKVVVPHELAHLFTSDAPTLGPHHAWPFEAIATALEHVVSSEVRRWSSVKDPTTTQPQLYEAMNRAFACPEEPFHAALRGACRTNLAGAKFPGRTQGRYAGDYSKFVFFTWYRRQHGDSTAQLAAWWQQYVGAGGNPKNLITTAELADFNLALLGDVEGQPAAFDPKDRAAFDDPAAKLDFAPPLRERYTFRFEEERYFLNNYRSAGVPVSSKAPQVPDTESFPLQPGATARILVEVPTLELVPAFPGLPTVTWKDDGPTPERRLHYVRGPRHFPDRHFVPFDATEAMLEPESLVLIPTGTRNLLVVLTTPPQTGTPPLRTRWGVTIGHKCTELCALHYNPQRLSCCGPACAANPYEGCVADCRDVYVDPRAEVAFCEEYCQGGSESYPVLFSGDPYAAAASEICRVANVPVTTPSGLVSIATWAEVGCAELVQW